MSSFLPLLYSTRIRAHQGIPLYHSEVNKPHQGNFMKKLMKSPYSFFTDHTLIHQIDQ